MNGSITIRLPELGIAEHQETTVQPPVTEIHLSDEALMAEVRLGSRDALANSFVAMHASSVELPTEFCAMDARQTTSSRTSSYWSIASVEPSTVPKARHAFLRSDRFPAKNDPARKLA